MTRPFDDPHDDPHAGVVKAMAAVHDGHPADCARARRLLRDALEELERDGPKLPQVAPQRRVLEALFTRLLPAVDQLEAGDFERARATFREALHQATSPERQH